MLINNHLVFFYNLLIIKKYINNDKYVFSQLSAFLPARVFDRCVVKYEGNTNGLNISVVGTRAMHDVWSKLSIRGSLRDLMVCINAHLPKHYHLGFGRGVSRSNLANANEKRDYRIYEDFAYGLIAEARKICQTDPDFRLSVEGNVYAFDSSVVDLCLNVF